MTALVYTLLAAALGCYVVMIVSILLSGWIEGLLRPKQQRKPHGEPTLNAGHKLNTGTASGQSRT